MMNPMHVKRSKELDDNLPTKHDRKDALVIARLSERRTLQLSTYPKRNGG